MNWAEVRYSELDKYNLVPRLFAALRRSGWWWDLETQKITCNAGYDWQHPWLTIRREKHRKCRLWHQIMFDALDKIFPPFCLECWKVVARPKTLDQHIRCIPVMEDMNYPSKLGVVQRPNTRGLYQCYFYNDSLEQAKETEITVHRRFHAEVSPEIEVYTKRFCTEFEEHFGPSDVVEVPEDNWEVAAIIEDLVDFPAKWNRQPPLLQERIVKTWIENVNEIGLDPTVDKYLDKKLAVECVRY